MIRQTLLALSILAATLPHAPTAQASYAAKWFDGNWDCKLGDMTSSAQMNWRMAYDAPNSKYIGKYRGEGSSWTPIYETFSNYNTLSIRFAKTPTTWTLTHYPKRRTAEGFMNIKGQRSPVSCTKSSLYDEPLKPEVEQPPVILNPGREEPKSLNPCKRGYVFRAATATDRVCVTPQIRTQTRRDNAAAASRREPNGGPYGPDTCKQGYVWREATLDDRVCVTPQTRSQAAEDNQRGIDRLVPKG
jgi:hypothetical protein